MRRTHKEVMASRKRYWDNLHKQSMETIKDNPINPELKNIKFKKV